MVTFDEVPDKKEIGTFSRKSGFTVVSLKNGRKSRKLKYCPKNDAVTPDEVISNIEVDLTEEFGSLVTLEYTSARSGKVFITE